MGEDNIAIGNEERVSDEKQCGDAESAGKESHAGDEKQGRGEGQSGEAEHAGKEDHAGNEEQSSHDGKRSAKEERIHAWSYVVEQMRSLDRKLSQCDVALDAAEKYGLMGTRDKWGWERR